MMIAALRLLTRIASLVMRILLVLPLAGLSSACTQSGAQAESDDGWRLIWSDEFNGAANSVVSAENWLHDTGTRYDCDGCPYNWGTGEIETMTSSTENVYLDGAGHLAIKPIRDAAGSWTSGRIETQRVDFQPPENGMLAVEASIQQPNLSGSAAAGYWPAFWMLGAPFRGNYRNWPAVGEIDIMEGVNGLNSVLSALHCGTFPGGVCNEPTGLSSGQQPCPGCQESFHTYRVELDRSVSPQQIRWYLDGVKFFSVDSDAVDAQTWADATDHGFFIILNVAIGGGFPDAFGVGPTPSTVSGMPMLVDYVRVYQRPAASIFLPVITSENSRASLR